MKLQWPRAETAVFISNDGSGSSHRHQDRDSGDGGFLVAEKAHTASGVQLVNIAGHVSSLSSWTKPTSSPRQTAKSISSQND